jgi:Cu/Zn superoxide dismutase
MSARTLAAALLVPVVAVACGEQGQQQAMSDQQETEQASAATDSPASAAGSMVALQPKNDSGITGEARWQAQGDSVQFTLSLQGLTEGDEYPAHVHRGTCTETGGVAAALSPVTGGSGGSGQSTAMVARSSFESGQDYYIQAHLPDGTPATCGNVPDAAALAADGGGEGGGM